jgi:hypothetical protein
LTNNIGRLTGQRKKRKNNAEQDYSKSAAYASPPLWWLTSWRIVFWGFFHNENLYFLGFPALANREGGDFAFF